MKITNYERIIINDNKYTLYHETFLFYEKIFNYFLTLTV